MDKKFKFFVLTEDEYDEIYRFIHLYFEIDVDDIKGPIFGAMFGNYRYDLHSIQSYIDAKLKRMDETERKRKLILKKEKPLFTVRLRGGKKRDYYLEGHIIRVPKELMGHIIGKKGRTIKYISNQLKRRIQVKELPSQNLRVKGVDIQI